MSDSLKIDYDVIIIGGALSGSSTALMLLRENPKLNILIIEKNPKFGYRVGESTVEISSFFLGKILGLSNYLNQNHLIKQGLRFWFYQSNENSFSQCSEVGSPYHVRLPGYQVDRSTLDEHILSMAVDAGAQLLRPATVKKVELQLGDLQKVTYQHDDKICVANGRWVVDASGVRCLMSKQLGWYRKNEAHPISSIWARWKNINSMEDLNFAQDFPDWEKRCHGTRWTATNHFVGKGWWAWCIPLKCGDVSIGLLYDERIVTLDQNLGLLERMRKLLNEHPVARRVMQNAEPLEKDIHYRKNLPYYSRQYFDDGIALVGDAAAFIDPLYSAGLDWVAYTTSAAVKLIMSERNNDDITDLLGQLNDGFIQSYDRWFNSLYLNKYFYIGEYDLMQIAFRLDLGLYYLGVVIPTFEKGRNFPVLPPYATANTSIIKFMCWYNRCLADIGKKRIEKNIIGKKNSNHFFQFNSYVANRLIILRLTMAILDLFKILILNNSLFKLNSNKSDGLSTTD